MAKPDPKGVEELLDNFDKNEGADYEDEILDDEDEGDDDADDTGDESGDSDEAGEEGEGDEHPAGEGGEDGGEVDAPSKFRALPGGLFADQKGNIVDPRTGQIIARAGSERRLYERGVRVQAELENRGERLIALQKELADVKFLDDMPRKLSLTNDEVFDGLNLVAKFKTDPVGAAKDVLALVAAQGHNISDITGGQVGDAVELNAIKRMLDERLAPILGEHQSKQRTAEVDKQAVKKLNEFFDTHEHSTLHVDILNKTVGDNPGMTPEKAYYELKLWCAKNQLDFTKELAPQIHRMREQRNRQQTPARQQRPMANGRGRGQNTRDLHEPDYADPKSSWDDILKSIM